MQVVNKANNVLEFDQITMGTIYYIAGYVLKSTKRQGERWSKAASTKKHALGAAYKAIGEG